MLVMQVAKHSPETCPAFDGKYRTVTVNWYEKVESVSNKFGVKFIGSWTDHPMHTIYVLFDTPSMDNLMKLLMEPEVAGPMAFCRTRVFPVFDHKQTLAMIKQAI